MLPTTAPAGGAFITFDAPAEQAQAAAPRSTSRPQAAVCPTCGERVPQTDTLRRRFCTRACREAASRVRRLRSDVERLKAEYERDVVLSPAHAPGTHDQLQSAEGRLEMLLRRLADQRRMPYAAQKAAQAVTAADV